MVHISNIPVLFIPIIGYNLFGTLEEDPKRLVP